MTPWVLRLLVANVVVFLLQQTLPAIDYYFAFIPRLVLTRPWTPLTYMFLHGGFGHIIFNMLSLYFFGSRLEDRLGGTHFLRLYLASGLAGALLSALFSFNAAIIGASGAVFGVMYGFAHFWPRERIYIWGVLPIEARWLVILTTAFALFSGLTGAQAGIAHFAHLGGYAGGWAYLAWHGRHTTAPAREWRKRVEAPVGAIDRTRIATIDMSRVHEVNREELNRILDKISASGIQSLTSSERTFLAHFAKADESGGATVS
jgi:membrane associated rhomboid family serine protease